VTEEASARRARKARLRGIVPYLVAGVLYVALGVWDPRFLLSWAEGIGFLLLVVWAIPASVRRWRR
jgi:hypothetical protein